MPNTIEKYCNDIIVIDAIPYTYSPMTNSMGCILANLDFIIECSRIQCRIVRTARVKYAIIVTGIDDSTSIRASNKRDSN